jgi:hypothetical protein
MKKAIVGIVALVSATLATLIETPVFAAAPAPVPYSWTGFYAGRFWRRLERPGG